MKKADESPVYYPVFLNLSGRRCVVVGGGQVALRKVKTLIEHRADVDVISPEVCSELVELAAGGEICITRRHYQEGDLRQALVAIAATDSSDVNLQVAQEARSNAVLVNVVDDAASSDFIVPSYIRRGDVTIAVSTAGRSPALARKIRSKLENEFGDEYASLAHLIGEMRAKAKRQGIEVDGDDWQEALDLDLLVELVRAGDTKKARTLLFRNLKARQK